MGMFVFVFFAVLVLASFAPVLVESFLHCCQLWLQTGPGQNFVMNGGVLFVLVVCIGGLFGKRR
jgi:hypothetical protein